MAIRVFLCEDHAIVRAGLIDILSSAGFEVAGEAATLSEVRAKLGDCLYDVVLVDLTLGDNDDGPAIIQTVIDINPASRIVVFTMRGSIHTMAASYRAGALGYVTKDSEAQTLLDAITTAAAGERYYMPGMAEKIATYLATSANVDPREVLDAKDLSIFINLAYGRSHEETAEAVSLKTKTVFNRTTHIQRALQCSRKDFTSLALRYGLLKPDA